MVARGPNNFVVGTVLKVVDEMAAVDGVGSVVAREVTVDLHDRRCDSYSKLDFHDAPCFPDYYLGYCYYQDFLFPHRHW